MSSVNFDTLMKSVYSERVKFSRSSVGPGTTVSIVLEVLSWALLWFRHAAYGGSPEVWTAQLIVWACFPVAAALISLIRDPDVAVLLLLAKGLLVFWASPAEAAFLPAQWSVFAALICLACTVLPSWRKVSLTIFFVGEMLVIDYLIPGMQVSPPDTVTTAAAVVCVLLPGFLVHSAQTAKARLESMTKRNDELHSSVLQLTSANTEFLEQANQAGEESAVLERHRITRDLHDVVGQTLTNIIMMMDASLHRKVQDPEETLKVFRWIRKQAQTGLEETRRVLYQLRTLRSSRLRGLKALKKLIDTFSHLSGIQTKVEWGNLPWTFNQNQERAVYHLVQGSLSNAFRHGSATRIDLHFHVDQNVLNIMVRDNGKGGSVTASGLGQQGMDERLAHWGGTVKFRSETFGYVVIGVLPLIPNETVEEEDTREPAQNSHR